MNAASYAVKEQLGINQASFDRATQNAERLGRLETKVESMVETVRADFTDFRSALKGIQETVGKSRETNWTVIFAGIAIVFALYGAAIQPMNKDLQRLESFVSTLNQSLLERNARLSTMHEELVRTTLTVELQQKLFSEMAVNGSPAADKRLTLLEYQIKTLTAKKP